MRQDQFGHDVNANYTFVPITVAGVTFKNGRRSRQTILRAIYWKDDPYRSVENVELVPTTFNDEPAVEVWVSSKKEREMIGYVPKEEAAYVHSHMNLYDGYFHFEVYGGGTSADGTKLSYGASVTLRFANDPNAVLTPDIPTPAELAAKRAIESAERALNDYKKPVSPSANTTSFVAPTKTKKKPKRKERNIFAWLLLFLIMLGLCFLVNK